MKNPQTTTAKVGYGPSGVTLAPQEVTAQLDRQLAAHRAEMTRVDGKAGLLLTGALGLLAISTAKLTAAGTWPAVATGWTAVVLGAAAVVLLALAVRPRLSGGYGLRRDDTGAEALLARAVDRAAAPELLHADLAADTAGLAGLATVKYRLIRLALDAMLAATGLALLSIVLR